MDYLGKDHAESTLIRPARLTQVPLRREATATLQPVTQATAASTIPNDLSELEGRAAKVLDPEALAYILAGAGDRGVPALEDQAA
jgi:hypothetical protein